MKERNSFIKNVYSSKVQEKESTDNPYMIMLKSLAICFVMSFLMILVYALILSFSSVSDASMTKVTQTILIISIAIASAYGGKKARRKGWLFGGGLGLLFAILMIPFSMAFGDQLVVDIYLMAKLVLSAVVGAIGGIIGVNLN